MITEETFRELATSFEEVEEKPHFEKMSFRVKNKIFATVEYASMQAVLKLTDQQQLDYGRLQPKSIYPVKGKWGNKGWTTFELMELDKDIVSAGLLDAYNTIVNDRQENNPLHGVKLKDILNLLVKEYGWNTLGQKIKIRCFTHDPSIKSSLTFLRRTPWAREKVEELYLDTIE